jgi:hypothetical protein
MSLGAALVLCLALLGVALIGIGWFIYRVELVEDRKKEERRFWGE